MENFDSRCNIMNLLKANNHLRVVNGEECMTPVGVVLALGSYCRTADSHEDIEGARAFIRSLMDKVQQAGYRHRHLLERMLLEGTPTKHLVGDRYFQDGDELELVLKMCGDALEMLGGQQGEIISGLLCGGSSIKH